MYSLENYLQERRYPGRGVLLGLHEDGIRAVAAYFIMGRSENSRNRIFITEGDGLRTEAFDPAKCSDPSLIIYAPVRMLGNRMIVSNGDQTDTVYDAMQQGGSFAQALRSRCYEPDAPNYTPRISGLLERQEGAFRYQLSILKHDGHAHCLRFFYEYAQPQPGCGHLIHTYEDDGKPLPAFCGEPRAVALAGEIDLLTERLWSALDAENRVSLFVRYLSPDGRMENRIINRNGGR